MARALVIGLGRQGQRHRRVLAGLGLKVDTVDPIEPEATFADMPAAAEAGKSYAAVAVAVPIRSLARVAIDAMFDFGAPLMMIEKPLGATADEVVKVDEAAAATGTLVVPGYTERFNPAVLQFAAMVADGDRAGVVNVAARRYSPDGGAPDVDPLVDLGVHDIDLAIRTAPGATVHVDAGYAPHRSRVFVAVHEDGVCTVMDLANRMVDNVAIDGAEPLVALWEDALAQDPGYRSLEHEVDVMRCAEFLVGQAAEEPAA
jgi:predicted dehydrogenase